MPLCAWGTLEHVGLPPFLALAWWGVVVNTARRGQEGEDQDGMGAGSQNELDRGHIPPALPCLHEMAGFSPPAVATCPYLSLGLILACDPRAHRFTQFTEI